MNSFIKNKLVWAGVSAMLSFPASAQFVTPTLPDQFIANVTTMNYATPSSSVDDVEVNCDMLQTPSGKPIKAIAWDESCHGQNVYLYFEDNAGNKITGLSFRGLRPDIVLADDRFNPGVNYRAAVVYLRGNLTPWINFYLLTGVGTLSFAVTQTGTAQLSTILHSAPLHDGEGLPHIDMWSDANNPIAGNPGMYEYMTTWEEGYDIMYAYGDVSINTCNTSNPPLALQAQNMGYADQPDVACFTETHSGQKIAAFTYRIFPGGAWSGLEVTEFDMATLAPTTASPYVLTNQFAWLPRIESMSQYDSLVDPAKWEVVCSYGDFPTATAYNAQSLGVPQDLGGVIGADAKSVCVAAGLKFIAGSSDIGNLQYTAGIFPWVTQNLFAREISAATGTIINPNYYQVNMNLLGTYPNYYEADASKSFALSNCSNSGEYLLSAWYDGHDVGGGTGGSIWMKLSPNTTPMVFKPTAVNSVKLDHELAIYPNPAKDKVYLPQKGVYKLYNIKGDFVLQTNTANDNTIDVSRLPAGVYIIRGMEDNSIYRFTKQ